MKPGPMNARSRMCWDADPAHFLTVLSDPTVGQAWLNFGHIDRQARELYLSMTRRGKMKEALKKWGAERRSANLCRSSRPNTRPGSPRGRLHGHPPRQNKPAGKPLRLRKAV